MSATPLIRGDQGRSGEITGNQVQVDHAIAYLQHLKAIICVDARRFNWVDVADSEELLAFNATTTLGKRLT